MKKRKNLNQEILIIAVLTLTVASLWVYLSIQKTLKKQSEKPIVSQEEISTFNPKLDESIFNELKQRNP